MLKNMLIVGQLFGEVDLAEDGGEPAEAIEELSPEEFPEEIIPEEEPVAEEPPTEPVEVTFE